MATQESKVINFNDNQPHKVSELICVKCSMRWLSVRPVDVRLKFLECPNCGVAGGVIETGEILLTEDESDNG